MALVHDDDLVRILGAGEGTVSTGHFKGAFTDSFMFIVLGDPPTRCGDGSPPKVET